MKILEEFKDIIGTQSYVTFLHMLKAIGPDARTHRISVVIAAMLQYAISRLPGNAACAEGTLAQALVIMAEEPYGTTEGSAEYKLVFDMIDELCREAGMRNLRESARGEVYSIAENTIAEYTAWYNMPWEDY